MRKNESRDWKELSWGTIASIAFHVVVGAVLLYQLPMPDFTPPPEETVSVEMVPPPPEEAEEPPQEEKAEEPPPPPAEEQQQEEQPPPPQETPPTEQAAAEIPIPVLRPVFEYGEQETGAAEAKDGDAASEAAKPPPEQTAEPQEQPIEPVKTPEAETQPTPEILTALANSDPAEAMDPLPGEVAETPPEKADVVEPEPEPEDVVADIPEAKKLFSKETNDDPIARAAMGDLPRSQRIARLCSSELYAQLKNGSPSYNAELVPSFELPKGNELKVPKAAFRSKNRWYDISFRCEVDNDGMRIQSFGMDVGAEVPKNQWRKRGFPSS